MISTFRFLVLLGSIWLTVGVAGLRAQTVTLQFSGQIAEADLLGGKGAPELFGLTTFPATFTATLTFSPVAHPAVVHLQAGDPFELSVPLAHELFLLPASAVVAMDVTIGNKVWTLADVEVLDWSGNSYSVLANTDLNTPPTLFQINFADGDGNQFRLGGLGLDTTISLENRFYLSDATSGIDGGGEFTISAVPEPSTYAAILGACALAGVVGWKRKRRERRGSVG